MFRKISAGKTTISKNNKLPVYRNNSELSRKILRLYFRKNFDFNCCIILEYIMGVYMEDDGKLIKIYK